MAMRPNRRSLSMRAICVIRERRHSPSFGSEVRRRVLMQRHRHVMATTASQWWQSVKIGPRPSPIETGEGWLLFYHAVSGTCNGFVYSIGAALLDLKEPSRVIAGTPHYLLTPEMPYETTGFVPNVAFPCAAITDAATGRIALYYGAADTYTALAACHAADIVAYLKEEDGV